MGHLDVEGFASNYIKGAKVFHGAYHRRMPPPYRAQVSVVVRASSRAAAHRALLAAGLRMSMHEFRGYWSEGGGISAPLLGQTPPGTVLYQPLDPHPSERGSWLPWELDWPARPA